MSAPESTCPAAHFYDGAWCALAPDHVGRHDDGHGLFWGDDECASFNSTMLLHGPWLPLPIRFPPPTTGEP